MSCPNSPFVVKTAAYAASLWNSDASVAVPKYFFPAPLAMVSSPPVALPPEAVDVGVPAGCELDGCDGGAFDDGIH